MPITIDGNGTIGGLAVGGLPDGTVTIDDLDTTAKGSIWQVKETHLDTTFSVAYSTNTDTDITNLNVSITPTSTTSKVLIFSRLNFEINTTSNHNMVFNLRRNGIFVGRPAADGSRSTGLQGINQGYFSTDATSTQDNMSFNFLDSPSTTSSIDYQVSFQSVSGTIMYVNRSVADTNNIAYERLTSSIIVMEVAG